MGKLFGTDGIRGKANQYPLNSETALKVGKAVGTVFANKKHKIVIGKDTRLSGYMLESALTAGICSTGCDVLLVGPLPTAAIAFLTRELNADAGIMITASHNPAEDNGIKILSSEGFKLSKKTEEKIEEVIFSEKFKAADGNKVGKVFRVETAKKRYIDFVKKSTDVRFDGLRAVVDCANGAAYDVGPAVLEELGADIVVMNNKPDGLNINKDCGATHPENLKKHVIKNRADIGIAFDGDADRFIALDEKGEVVDGDKVMAICAIDLKERGKLKKDTLVVTVMSNIGLDIAMKKHGIKLKKTPVGDQHVAEEMKNSGAVIGGEQSGHIIFFNHNTTGDGIISAIQTLSVMKRSKKKLSELAGCMEEFPQVLVNVEVKEKKKIEKMPSVVEVKENVEKKLHCEGRVLVRYSGTQNLCRVMIEGKDTEEIKKYADMIAKAIKEEIG